jgi:branched-chain amino acid transport system ATP-binding protein
MLRVHDLNAWYGPSHVLQGVSLEVGVGEIVCLIGRNGAGKTTTLKAVMGLIAKRRGRVLFAEEDILARPAHTRFALGLAYVPEERRIVPGLTVGENLRLGLIATRRFRDAGREIAAMVALFPRLGERLDQIAVTLSGGEQQMLAIARAMIAGPRMILLDEPSEGIMPALVDEMFALFTRLRQSGTTILLVEQNVERALEIADRAYILDQGVIVHEGRARALLADAAIKERYCSV